MGVEVVTKDDLEAFRLKLLGDIKDLLSIKVSASEKLEGLKTSDARKILGCSINKLVALRINRKIRTKKIGGTLYYNREDIAKLLTEGF